MDGREGEIDRERMSEQSIGLSVGRTVRSRLPTLRRMQRVSHARADTPAPAKLDAHTPSPASPAPAPPPILAAGQQRRLQISSSDFFMIIAGGRCCTITKYHHGRPASGCLFHTHTRTSPSQPTKVPVSVDINGPIKRKKKKTSL